MQQGQRHTASSPAVYREGKAWWGTWLVFSAGTGSLSGCYFPAMPTSRRMGARPSDQVSRFFSDLQHRGHEPLLARATGTLRFDLCHGRSVDRWYVTVTKGDLEVSRDEREADVVLNTERSVFIAMTEGKANTMAAVLRGDVQLAGDLSLAMAFQRVLPGPPDAVGPRGPSRPREDPDG